MDTVEIEFRGGRLEADPPRRMRIAAGTTGIIVCTDAEPNVEEHYRDCGERTEDGAPVWRPYFIHRLMRSARLEGQA